MVIFLKTIIIFNYMSTQRFISLFAATALALSLAACGGGGDDVGPVTPGPNPQQPSPDPSPNPNPGPNPSPDPAPGDASTSASCINDAMWNAGSSWTVAKRQTSSSSLIPVVNTNVTTTVTGTEAFNGHNATVRREHDSATNETDLIYSARVGGDHVTYGSQGRNENDAPTTYRFDPPLSVPVALALNQAYTAQSVMSGSDQSRFDFEQESTYLGRESLRVAAGSFDTCKVSIKTTMDRFSQVVETWYVASGPYRGLHIKSEFELPMVGKIVSEATHVEASFK